MLQNNKNNKAFTILEGSIVLIIVGLMISAVLISGNIRRNAQLLQIITDARVIQTAFNQYVQRYNQLPGDTYNATTLFGTSVNSITVSNGDGDYSIADDWNLVFQHLELAGLLKGEYTTSTATPSDGIIKFLMAGPLASSYYSIYEYSSSGLSRKALYFGRYLGDLDSSGAISASEVLNATLTPKEAQMLDLKFDDGLPTTGWIRAAQGTDFSYTTNVCVSSSSYVISDTVSCYLIFLLEARTLDQTI